MFFDRQKRTALRFRFLASAMEEVKTCDSNICDIVILPLTSREQEFSNEENDDSILDQDYRPDEVAEVEIHDISTKSEDCITTDASPQWRKKHLSLGPHEAPSSSDNIQQHVGKDNFEIFYFSRNQ